MNAFTQYTTTASESVGTAAESVKGIPWMWIGIGIFLGAVIGIVIFIIIPRANTRPIKDGFRNKNAESAEKEEEEGFLSMPVKGVSGVPCGQMSSEAEAVYQFFASRKLSVGEEGDMDLQNLQQLLGKMCCMKRDLMSPAQSVSSARELAFATHMDIQPVADLTANCFAKTVPERDLSIQFEKWRNFGMDMIRRLCTAGSLSESEVNEVEALFKQAWKDCYDVANTVCIGTIPTGAFATGPHDPAPRTPENLAELRDYDGPGSRY